MAPRQNIAGQLAVLSALFDNVKRPRAVQFSPHLKKLHRQQATKKWADAHACEEIAALPRAGRLARIGIIAKIGMIKRKLHEALKGDRTMGANLLADER